MSVPMTIGKLIDFFSNTDPGVSTYSYSYSSARFGVRVEGVSEEGVSKADLAFLLPSPRFLSCCFVRPNKNTLWGMTFPVAASILCCAFAVGAAANAMRAILMKTSGQRIIARVRFGSLSLASTSFASARSRKHNLETWTDNSLLVGLETHRNESYKNVLRQEVEFGDTTTGDILSRLGSDTSIVGDSVTNNLSDGLR